MIGNNGDDDDVKLRRGNLAMQYKWENTLSNVVLPSGFIFSSRIFFHLQLAPSASLQSTILWRYHIELQLSRDSLVGFFSVMVSWALNECCSCCCVSGNWSRFILSLELRRRR